MEGGEGVGVWVSGMEGWAEGVWRDGWTAGMREGGTGGGGRE